MTVLADSIANKEHLKVFDDMVESRINDLDFSVVIPNLVDIAPSNMLPVLAGQFDVLGIKGFRFTNTDLDRKALIKKAIKLHKYKGTVYAIKESLKVLGINNVVITEHVLDFRYDGEYNYDAHLSYAEGNWATFRVTVDGLGFDEIDATLLPDIVALINAYKNTRSHLVDVSFGLNFTETINTTDIVADNDLIMEDIIGAGVYYDAYATYNGGVEYNRTLDEFTYIIL